MTKTLSTKFYKEIRDKLPQAIIDGVLSYDTTLKVEEIALKHKLQIDQIGVLVDIIQDIGYGILASKDFLETVKNELNLSGESLLPLVEDINEQIFKPVRAEMLKAFKDEAPNKPRTIATIDEHDTHHETLSKAEILSEIENPHPVVGRKEGGSNREVSSLQLVVGSKKETPQTSTPSSVLQTTNPPEQQTSYKQPVSPSVTADIRARLLSSLGEDKLSHVVTMKKIGEVSSEQLVVGSKKEIPQTETPSSTPQTSTPSEPVLQTNNYKLPTSSAVSPKLQALSEVKTKIKDPFKEVGSEQTIVGSDKEKTISPVSSLQSTNYPPEASSRIVDPYREPIN